MPLEPTRPTRARRWHWGPEPSASRADLLGIMASECADATSLLGSLASNCRRLVEAQHLPVVVARPLGRTVTPAHVLRTSAAVTLFVTLSRKESTPSPHALITL